jgi:hypothetical protein
MQLAERLGYPTPVCLRLGRSALHVGHHHQTVGEQPAVRGRDRHRHGQTRTVEVLEQLGLPREISARAPPIPLAHVRGFQTSLAWEHGSTEREGRAGTLAMSFGQGWSRKNHENNKPW